MHSLRKLSQIKFINRLSHASYVQRHHLCTAKQSSGENDGTASFGFQTVRESEKEGKGIFKWFFLCNIVGL